MKTEPNFLIQFFVVSSLMPLDFPLDEMLQLFHLSKYEENNDCH
tara:strand:- start:95 stop:226 length:132 start_codon:yes stop_codon:yes gene_type:complete